MNNTEVVLTWFHGHADPEGLIHGVNARTIANQQQVGLTYDQVKYAVRQLIAAGEIDRITEPTDEDGTFLIYSVALAAARAEEII